MNDTPDINKLFEAARRREADIRRQQQLSDMIDRLAKDEQKTESGKRKAKGGLFWTYAGIAASVLLLSIVGLRILSQDSTSSSQQQLIAKTKPHVESEEKSAESGEQRTESVVQLRRPNTSAVLAISETTAEVPSHGMQQNESEEDETIIEMPVVLPDEPLLAEETQNGEQRTEDKDQDMYQHESNSPVVYERTSTRLVCGSGCRPEVRHNQEDTPSFAFTNISSTGTTIGIGSSGF